MYERSLGPQHPEVARALATMALVYDNQVCPSLWCCSVLVLAGLLCCHHLLVGFHTGLLGAVIATHVDRASTTERCSSTTAHL